MLTETFDFSELLDPPGIELPTGESELARAARVACYEREVGTPIDYRLRQVSYSSFLKLHECPRKYQLSKYKVARIDVTDNEQITFSYGHCVGLGIQMVLEKKSRKDIYLALFAMWKPDLMAEGIDRKGKPTNKSIWSAFIAVEKFNIVRHSKLDDYELVYYQGKPAIELSFCIILPNGFRLRGYVDAVLRHRETGAIIVLENKTTKDKDIAPAKFKNSAQAIGYSIVLDVIAPEISSYDVLYWVYSTSTNEYTPLEFTKTYLQRAQWIKTILLEIEEIERYVENNLFPMRGESCYNYFRECEYLQVCELTTDIMLGELKPEHMDMEEYTINLTVVDLIDAQIRKVEG